MNGRPKRRALPAVYAGQAPAALPSAAVDAIVAAVESGARFEAALVANGVDPALVHAVIAVGAGYTVRTDTDADFSPAPQLMESTRELLQRVKVAQAKAEVELAQVVYQASLSRNERTGIPEWRAGLEWLKHADDTRDHWREHRELTVHGDASDVDSEERRAIRQLSDQELRDALPAEWRELMPPAEHNS